MTCSNCNTCGKDPCGCGGCQPAKYSCGNISITPNPYDPSIWMVTIQGATTKVKLKSDLSKYFFYPEKAVKKTGTKLEVTPETKTLRSKLGDALKGQVVERLDSKTYDFFQSGSNHHMYYVKLSPKNAGMGLGKGYVNVNACTEAKAPIK